MRQSFPLLLSLFAVLVSPATRAAHRVFQDDFADASTGWYHHGADSSDDLGFAIYTAEGTYQMTPVRDEAYGFVAAPRQTTSPKVRVSADLFLYAGVGLGGGGVGCHYLDESNFDLALARGDGQLVLVEVRKGDSRVLAQGPLNSLFPGSVDTRLELECDASGLRVRSQEGTRLEAATSPPAGHQVGLFVIGERSAGTSAVFDNFTLDDLAQP